MSHGVVDHLNAPRRQWWAMFVFGGMTILSGTAGVLIHEHEHGGKVHVLGAFYHAFQMLILHTAHLDGDSNLWLEVGRWCGVATLFSFGAVLFGRRLLRECRLIRLIWWKNHCVICGLGKKGFALAKCRKEHDGGARIVVVDLAPDEHLWAECERLGICVLAGDASRPEVLEAARIDSAAVVIVITPEDEINVRIVAAIRHRLKVSRKSGPACHVHLSDIHLREALQQDLAPGGLRLHFFDVFDTEARRVMAEAPYLDGTGLGKDDPRSVHVVILGFSRMGRSLALAAARLGHFANGKPLRISVIDRHADLQRERFLFRYPIFEGTKLCSLTFHNTEAESSSARKQLETWAGEANILLHVFICLDDDARGLEVALRLQRLLRGRPDTSLRVRIHSQRSLAPILEASASVAPAITHFGTVEDTCSNGALGDEQDDEIARTFHEEFVTARLGGSRRSPDNDPALRPWDQLHYDFRHSNRQQADHIAIKLRAIGCELVEVSDPRPAVECLSRAEIKLLAPVEHSRWNAERWLAGWIYGTPSVKEHRINENLVPWDVLDPSIQKYDEETVEKMPALLKKAKPGWKIVRLRSS